MAKTIFWITAAVLVAGVAFLSMVWEYAWWLMVLFGPLILLGIYDMLQKRHTILRNFPVLGHFRYLFELVRPELMQYFVETDTEGRPYNRIIRTMIYQRAKKQIDTTPFGTQYRVYRAGYEWMEHSIYARDPKEEDHDPRIVIGGPDCQQPYSSSLLNVSAMSFGSLSNRAVLALNKGAKMGGFSHNTGEGGLSPYHLEPGGDLVWQIGTGYFGARDKAGNFSPEHFRENALKESVKMIELKISQGAKPGHGGILPASKNTEEIARIRGVEPHTNVHSPPGHSAFNDSYGLLQFIKLLRDLSDGKPVGFKLCIGRKEEFVEICEAMVNTGIKPDFISVDGGEGGTGAAPVEFSNAIGTPLRDGLIFAYDTLVGFDLKKDIKLIASGKIVSGFHVVRALALGADVCNSARAMMMATGCIQALQCNRNTCPVGVATQDKALVKGLVVKDKAQRVANYHEETVGSCAELLGALGLDEPQDIKRKHINRRVALNKVMRYDEIFPYPEVGSLLKRVEV